MKNKYRMIPLGIVVITILSIFYLLSNNISGLSKYNSEVSAARQAVSNKSLTVASEHYLNALNINPSLDLYIEYGNTLIANDEFRSAEKLFERNIISRYPDKVDAYAFGINLYASQEDYDEVFRLYKEAKNNNIKSAKLEEIINPIKYKYDLLGSYDDALSFGNSSGYAAVSNGGSWYFINEDAYSVINNQYKFVDNFFAVETAVIDQNNNTYLIDNKGNPTLTKEYFINTNKDINNITKLLRPQNGFVLGFDGSNWHYFDHSSSKLKFGGYKDATLFSNDVALVSKNGSQYALINTKGKELTDYIYQDVVKDERNNITNNDVLILRKNNLYYLCDLKGNQISNTTYEAAKAFIDSYAAVKKNGKWIFVDTKGKEYDLGSFEDVKSFSYGIAAVKKNNRWGFIDYEGKLVIDYQFKDTKLINTNGLGFVQTDDNKWQVIRFYKGNN